MERQLPKNVRQIGNVSDNPKIYVEDYVDTYLNQLREKAKEQPVGVILAGEVLELEDEKAVFVSGAVQMQELSEKDGKLEIGLTAQRAGTLFTERIFSDGTAKRYRTTDPERNPCKTFRLLLVQRTSGDGKDIASV